MNTVEAIVMSVTGAGLAYGYCWYRWKQRQSALQWFYAQQANALSTQSDNMRERLFQKAFALRRALELGVISSPEAAMKHLSQCLTLAEDFNTGLEQMSDELSVPFVEDSLPLALQHLTQRWGLESADIELTLALPSDWPWQSTPDKHRLVLWCVHTCWFTWQSRLPQAVPQQLTLGLVQANDIAKLRLSCKRPVSKQRHEVTAVGDVSALKHTQQVFQILMPGRCKLTCSDSALEGEFSWSLTNTQ